MLTPWYVTGFCDGEAAFTYSKAGGTFGLYFALRQREDNRQIIEEIREYFNYAGKIYQGEETKTSAYYRITKIDELKAVVTHFDKYPLQSKTKLEAYKIWREMVIYKTDNYRNIDYEQLRTLAERLSRVNAKGRDFPSSD